MDNYNEQAEKFLSKTNTTFTVKYIGKKFHFPDDAEKRDVYEVSLQRDGREYTFTFGDSLKNTAENDVRAERVMPSAYDVLACLTKYEPEDDIDEFAANYGIWEPSVALRTYEAVKKEWEGVQRIWSNEAELDELREIN